MLKQPFISIFASAIRCKDWEKFYTSLLPTSEDKIVEIEIVFAGPILDRNREDFEKFMSFYEANKNTHVSFKHIETGDIKPAQCYEIARRHCTGYLAHWSADDSEYSPDCIYELYKVCNEFADHADTKKLMFSIQTVENNIKFDMTHHAFFGHKPETPLMAPLGVINRELFEEIGGIDARYDGGQWENDVVMRVDALEGSVHIFTEGFMTIPHYEKHSRNTKVRTNYPTDRKILENSWSRDGVVTFTRYDTFKPYPKELNYKINFVGE